MLTAVGKSIATEVIEVQVSSFFLSGQAGHLAATRQAGLGVPASPSDSHTNGDNQDISSNESSMKEYLRKSKTGRARQKAPVCYRRGHHQSPESWMRMALAVLV
jgi:hypothetical protein